MYNYKNYYVYADAVESQSNISVYVPSITAKNIDDHIDGIYAILKDGIETGYVHNLLVNVSWGGDANCDLYVIDYWFSLFMWKMVLNSGGTIRPKHIFWQSELKRNNIKSFVDKYVLTKENKIQLGNAYLNEVLYNGLWAYSYIESFSWYLANTINNEDNIALMNQCPEYYQLLHCSLAGVPFDKVKDVGMQYTNRAIEIIKDSQRILGYDHGLAASFKASEAINPRQFKEAELNIGTKPNGTGGIFPYIIDKNFMNGGVDDLLSFFIESNAARAAQIMSKTNVGESGDFARCLGMNNSDTILNTNMTYECLSKHFIKFEIKTSKHLSMVKNRYYRFTPMGVEYVVDPNDTSLIGKTIFMHSPMTCQSKATGHGICKRCYGDLYYTNLDINVGKLAAEILSAQLTQTLLSAKHLLETKIQTINWNPEFDGFFDLDINAIKLTDDLSESYDLKKCVMVIDPNDIYLVNEEEDAVNLSDDEEEEKIVIDDNGTYNEYITSFIVRTGFGDIKFGSDSQDELYISHELNEIIRKKATPDGGKVNIKLSDLTDITLFYIKIINNEISKTMNDIINIINKSSVTEKMTKDEALQSIVDLVVEGNLSVDAVHLEVILSNQIVAKDDVLAKPNFSNPYTQYRMITLNQALTNNPSIIVSLLYKDLHRTLYNPLTYRKNAPSFFDLFFCEQPQVYMSEELLDDKPKIDNPEKGITMVRLVDKKKE